MSLNQNECLVKAIEYNPVQFCKGFGQEKANKKARRQLGTAMIFCFLIMIGEAFGGYWSNSLAILSDSSHMLSDVVGLGISYIASVLSERSATHKYSFGYHRVEVLAALVSVLMIWVITAFLFYAALDRLKNPTAPNGKMMFLIATGGFISNMLMGVILSQTGHVHSHGIGGGQCKSGHSHDSHAKHHDDDHCSHDRRRDHNSHDHEKEHHNHACGSINLSQTGHEHSHGIGGEQCKSGHNHDSHANHHDDDHCSHDHRRDHNSHDHEKKHQNHACGSINLEDNHPSHGHGHGHSHSHNHGHGHGHGHGHMKKKASFKKNVNVYAAWIHVIGDCLQSLGVMIAAAIIWYNPKWQIADPICTFIFSFIVVCTTFRLVFVLTSILMDSVPDGIDLKQIGEKLMNIKSVVGIHDIHCWELSPSKSLFAAHIVVRDKQKEKEALSAATALCREYKIMHTTIQMETVGDQLGCCY